MFLSCTKHVSPGRKTVNFTENSDNEAIVCQHLLFAQFFRKLDFDNKLKGNKSLAFWCTNNNLMKAGF